MRASGGSCEARTVASVTYGCQPCLRSASTAAMAILEPSTQHKCQHQPTALGVRRLSLCLPGSSWLHRYRCRLRLSLQELPSLLGCNEVELMRGGRRGGTQGARFSWALRACKVFSTT